MKESPQQITHSELFTTFLKIGVFTFGGGYAMIPLIEREVVTRRGWVEQSDFVDLLTLAQSVPGPIALNSAAFVGYKSRGYLGALSSILGIVVPSFVIILAVALVFGAVRDNAIVNAAFNAMRPVVVALIVAPTISLMKGMHPVAIFATLASIVAFALLELSPAWPIFGSALVGALWSYGISKRAGRGER